MPRYTTSDIAHTASVDHRILRRPGSAVVRAAMKNGTARFVPLHPEHYGDDEKGLRRDLGLALVEIFAKGKASPSSTRDDALSLLDAAVENDPEDWEAAAARGLALAFLQRPADALAAYEALLAGAPHREAWLVRAAMIAQMTQKFDLAVSYWRRAVAASPHEANYRAKLTRLLAHQKNWSEARPHCEAWLDLDPSNLDARTFWVSCLLHSGDRAGAHAEFEKIKRLRPSNLPLLEARFAVELRSP